MKMPVLFVGHGSPMNAIEDNEFTQTWRALGEEITRPHAVLCISAHWFTSGARVNTVKAPNQVYDMYGFPDRLYRMKYEAPGAPELSQRVIDLIPEVWADNAWGIDHGAWTVLSRMYPKADIPVTQLSVDYGATAEAHYHMGEALKPLREEGVLILASGNVVHDLRRVSPDMQGGYSWADEFDAYIQNAILEDRLEDTVHYTRAGRVAKEAFPTPDHYNPLLYALGAKEMGEPVQVFNEKRIYGSLSMTGYRFG